MAVVEKKSVAKRNLTVSSYTNGVLDPSKEMLGPLEDGGTLLVNTAPGCWGPMITPCLHGGHEVTTPVYVEGAAVGDAVAIRIRDITVTSLATASGHDAFVDGHYQGDPYVAKRNPSTGKLRPNTHIEGVGQDAVRDDETGEPITPFKIVNGYTVVFDASREVGVTVPKEATHKIAERANHYAAMPDNSVQHSILHFAPHDIVGTMVRLRPFLGQLGTTPSKALPDSHNAGDFGSALVGAPHEYAITEAELEQHRTDGHMDIDAVRPGTILLAPVKVPGAGVYLGDMHALQGDGEIAGHTMDVAGTVTLQVDVVKGRTLEGPVLFPLVEDLPPLARPLTTEERQKAIALAREWGVETPEETAPISVIGTGPTLNAATDNGLARAATLLDMSIGEVRNRATINGGIEIGRHPGVIQVTFLAPLSKLEQAGLLPFVKEQYGIG